MLQLFYNCHFFNQVLCICIFINNEKHITNINTYCSLKSWFKSDITAHCFPVSIKRTTYQMSFSINHRTCLLYTSDAADDMQCVDLGGRRINKKKKTKQERGQGKVQRTDTGQNYSSRRRKDNGVQVLKSHSKTQSQK
eukprot:TRINITY_DN28108_c0_g1_i2.p1 TRINITY_DN28108_c0_g1~~TRINITY_DN28108_c0_g1_i2.p1  ORF type:complete len:138 (+),score=3.13 TRINITY_DN28108_c0_g1_i2:75-488(+)